jgi:oligosaccharyltransferase complex subunit beta
MLDPYYRVFLKHSDKKTPTYRTSFRVPDKLGIYKFRVTYKRYGWSYVNHESKVVLRQFRHNEYERFLPVAYPYYAGVMTSMAGFMIFSMAFMYSNFKKVN